MTIRVRLACAAALLLLVSAQASLAQQADTTAALHGSLPGRGAIGGQIGGSWIVAEQDYSKGAQPRFSFTGQYDYVISNRWRWQVSPYFTWNAYRVGSSAPFADPHNANTTRKDFYLTQIVGGNAQIQWVHGKGGTLWHLGVGPAIYRVVVQDDRAVVKDPVTKRLHQGAYLGATAEWGIEHFTKSLPNTSIEWTVAAQSAFAKRDDQFPSGFNSNVIAVEARLGAKYYYDFKKAKKPDAKPASRP